MDLVGSAKYPLDDHVAPVILSVFDSHITKKKGQSVKAQTATRFNGELLKQERNTNTSGLESLNFSAGDPFRALIGFAKGCGTPSSMWSHHTIRGPARRDVLRTCQGCCATCLPLRRQDVLVFSDIRCSFIRLDASATQLRLSNISFPLMLTFGPFSRTNTNFCPELSR